MRVVSRRKYTYTVQSSWTLFKIVLEVLPNKGRGWRECIRIQGQRSRYGRLGYGLGQLLRNLVQHLRHITWGTIPTSFIRSKD